MYTTKEHFNYLASMETFDARCSRKIKSTITEVENKWSHKSTSPLRLYSVNRGSTLFRLLDSFLCGFHFAKTRLISTTISRWCDHSPEFCPPFTVSCNSLSLPIDYPEDGDRISLRRDSTCLPNYTATHPRLR